MKPIENNSVKPGGSMRQEKVQYFTEKEEVFANLLIENGTKKNEANIQLALVRKLRDYPQ